MASASSSRPLPFVNGAGVRRTQHREEMARHLVAEVVRVAALADLAGSTGFSTSRDAVHVGVLRRLRLAQRLDVGAQPVDVAPAVGAQLPLEAPAAEREQARLDRRPAPARDRTPSCRSRWKTSVQRLLRSTGRLFSSRPQPGQKSSLVTNSFGSLRRLLLLRAGQRLGADDVVLFLDLLAARTSRRAAAPGTRRPASSPPPRVPPRLDHLLPLRQVRIEPRRLREELEPALEQLVIELLGVDDLRDLFLRLAGHLPRRLHVLRRLERQRLGRAASLSVRVNSSSSFSFFSIFLSCALYSSTTALRRERILVVRRVQEHAGERVVVLGRNRVVLVIVAARAATVRPRKPRDTTSTRSCRSSARVISTAPLS